MKKVALSPKKVAIAAKVHAKEVASVVSTLVKWLAERGIAAHLESSLAAEIKKAEPSRSFSLEKVQSELYTRAQRRAEDAFRELDEDF